MANPMLNDKALEESRAGWAAPTPPSPGGQTWPAPTPGTAAGRPVTDGPVSSWQGAMSVRGTINKTAFLLALLVAAATAGWFAVTTETATVLVNGQEVQQDVVQFPAIATLGIIVGFVAVLVLNFKPHLAKILGPIYAVGFGFAVGAISKGYESFQSGIVLQAAGATVAVFAVMLALYKSRIIKVTDRFRRTVVFATLGLMVFYGISLIMSLFGASPPFINDATPLGIGLSVVICVLAALNLALDFDFIEKGSKMGLAKDFEWFGAVGLVVTIVWLYLEMLRLLAKLQQR
jgi:uncharacterized YccA/Bax inhibitor family protein